ncbi:hypothetical protein LEM8419_03087 [Neolewinella maritima]|uniref:Outer membrane protein beta-barrel domain-containing protein n=1 Tax=Neolewinella maritima TaxID=1383882 RepID=A0ABN8FCS7_9BACT|nr:porin family protein [Neolewinella maritima]CAH1002170.1 hypothetical protein LEM8419_03087 [Neolewinella maritima]
MPLPRILCLFALLTCTSLTAQEFSGGFRAGLNFISFDGDAEMGAIGGSDMTLEEFNRTTGFHVGATFAYAFTDLFGFKADLMYSQKGGEVLYTGPSYFFLYAPDGTAERIQGELQSERDALNSYIDIPVVAYYRLGPLELEGGLSMGLLVNSRASGSATYTANLDPQGRGLADLSYNYDYNYFDETIGRNAALEFSNTSAIANAPAVVNAYYNATDNRPLYRRLDFGLVGGVSYFLNNGLYLGARYQLGLTDVTRGENDQRLYSAPGGSEEIEYNTDDKDYNRVIQASVGFRF